MLGFDSVACYLLIIYVGHVEYSNSSCPRTEIRDTVQSIPPLKVLCTAFVELKHDGHPCVSVSSSN